MESTETHAEANARLHRETMEEAYAAVEALKHGEEGETVDVVYLDGNEFSDVDEIREYMEQQALSVQVRSGWTSLGEEMVPEEFEIILSTGGPALRIVGDLDEHGEPSRPRLQYRDWGTPWMEYILTGGNLDALRWFCGLFYFGD